MYNRLIFINFISISKKVKPKSKSCIKHFFTVYKLLRLWYFVSVLNLKFLDQLERRYCKDTPFFRPFYIGAPKGPFLPGLNIYSQKWNCAASFPISTFNIWEWFTYSHHRSHMESLYIPVLHERLLSSAVGAERRAGNCHQAVVGGSSLSSPLLLRLSQEFT